jgi:hypothetical protein
MKTMRVLLILAFVFTSISGALAFEKTILVEYFTNVNCGPCAGQHDPIENMLENYTREEIAYICYHTSWPSSSDGYYVGNIPENTGRWNYYGVNYVPWFQCEGLWGDYSQLNSVLPIVTPRIGTYTPYQITFGDWPDFGNDVPITATLTCAEATQGDMRFNIVLVDKSMVVAVGSNGVDDYSYNMIDMAYNYTGESFTSNGGNEELVYDYTFAIPNNNTFGNLGVVAFVQNYTTGEIFQAAYMSSPVLVISGQVTHALTGGPIEGAEMLLNGGDDGTVVTNADGYYIFNGLGEGDYEITASLENYVDITIDSQFYEFGTYTLDFVMENENVDMPMIGYFETEAGIANGGTIVDNYGYFAQGGGGLQIVDVSDPTDITTVGSTTIGGTATDVVVNEPAAYMATTEGFKVVDVSDPANPASGQGMNFGSTGGLAVSGNYLLAASATNGLVVMNASNPLNPQFMTMFATSGSALDVVIQGTYAYVAISENGLAVIDVSTPSTPVLVSELDLGATSNALDLAGNIAYIALGSSGFAAVDISDPANPVHLSTLATGGEAVQIKVVDNVVFIANEVLGQRAYDASDPNNMTELGYSLTPENTNHVTVAGNVVYGSDERFIYAIDASIIFGGNSVGDNNGAGALPSEITVNAAYPNPFNPTTSLALSLPMAADVTVQVFNVIGQQVTTLTEGPLSAGQHTLTFDATDLTSGVYFIHTNVPDQYSNVQKVLLVR